MKKFVRCVSILLVTVLLFATPAYATESTTPKSSYYFGTSSTYLVQISTFQFKAYFEITATGTMAELGAKTVKIQRSSDGVNWTTMQTYSSDNYSNMISTNTVFHGSYFTYSGSPGYKYRAKVTYYAKNSSGTGQVTEYSETLTIPFA